MAPWPPTNPAHHNGSSEWQRRGDELNIYSQARRLQLCDSLSVLLTSVMFSYASECYRPVLSVLLNDKKTAAHQGECPGDIIPPPLLYVEKFLLNRHDEANLDPVTLQAVE